MNPTTILTTAIICVTLILLCLIGRKDKHHD